LKLFEEARAMARVGMYAYTFKERIWRRGDLWEPISKSETYEQTEPDDEAGELVSTFVCHVAAVARGERRIETIVCSKALIIAALTNGEGPHSSAWRTLYQYIAQICAVGDDASNTRSAQYLRAFIRENDDLACEVDRLSP
jgi:hypothetical protein